VDTPLFKRAILSRNLPHTNAHTHDTLKSNISVIFRDLRLKLIQGTNVNIPNLLLQNLLKSENLRFTYTSVLLTARFYGVIRRLHKDKILIGDLEVSATYNQSWFHTRFSPGTVKPLITNTSEEFIKCCLDNFSMSFIVIFSICENK